MEAPILRPPNPGVPEMVGTPWSFYFVIAVIVISSIVFGIALYKTPPFEERCAREAAKLGAEGKIVFRECWADFGDGTRPVKL